MRSKNWMIWNIQLLDLETDGGRILGGILRSIWMGLEMKMKSCQSCQVEIYMRAWEPECWNSKRRQPNTSTSVHLYIDGFSCCYQLMPLAGMFVPIIPFHDHMILFSDSPLISLPSFLHDSLTMRFCIFLFLLYLVMFISCPSDVVPHLSATSEVSYFIYMILHPISYWLCTCSYHIYRWIYLDVVPHLSATSELSYLQIPPCSFCVSITQNWRRDERTCQCRTSQPVSIYSHNAGAIWQGFEEVGSPERAWIQWKGRETIVMISW